MNINSIAFRKLTKKEAEILTKEVRNTPNIVAVPIEKWGKFDKVFISENDGEMSGVCVIEFFDKDWAEIADFIVLPHHRGKGIGRKLYDRAFEFLKNNQKNIYIVSRNPVVIAMMRKSGFRVFDSFGMLPSAVKNHAIKKSIYLSVASEFIRKLFAFPHKTKFVYGILRKEDYEKKLE